MLCACKTSNIQYRLQYQLNMNPSRLWSLPPRDMVPPPPLPCLRPRARCWCRRRRRVFPRSSWRWYLRPRARWCRRRYCILPRATIASRRCLRPCATTPSRCCLRPCVAGCHGVLDVFTHAQGGAAAVFAQSSRWYARAHDAAAASSPVRDDTVAVVPSSPARDDVAAASWW